MPIQPLNTLCSAFFLAACAFLSAADYPPSPAFTAYLNTAPIASIDSVQVTENNVRVRGRVEAGTGPFQLIEIPPHQPAGQDLNGHPAHPVQTGPQKNFEIALPRFADGRDRLYARWALTGADRKPLSFEHWADAVDSLRPDLKLLKPASKKGANGIGPGLPLEDLADLGVKNITLNISFAGLLSLNEPDTIPHTWNGKTYRFRTATVAYLDQVVRFASRHDMIVTAILLVPRLDRATELGKILTHPAATDGHYSMANLTTPEGAEHYIACVRFLADRYSNQQAGHGRIANWIVHNEVDAGWSWANMGEADALTYLETYHRVMRLTHLATRQFDPHARSFISLTHSWTESHQPQNPRFYASRPLLEYLLEFSRAEGDFDWGVAHHPYPENLGNPRTWLDKKALDHPDSPYITFKNIEQLDAWARQPENFYRNRPRSLLLSEQGFHSLSNSPEHQALQAAALAYAWKKIKNLDTIEAFHYHRWIDHEREGGLKLGLWTVQPGSIFKPLDKKQSWHVFKAMDTPQEEEVFQFALPVIGLTSWGQIRP